MCQDAEQTMQDLVNHYYQGDCNNALDRSFTHNVKREFARNIGLRRREFGDNWEFKIYKECASDALDRETEKVGRECSSTAGSDCNRLGKEVARLIVRQAGICGRMGGGRGEHPLGKFQRACHRSATNACEGFIRDAARECGGSIYNVNQENELADDCRGKVYELTGYKQPTTTQIQSVVCTGGCSSDPYCAVTTEDTGTSKISWRVFEQTNDPWHQDDDQETTIKVMHADKRPKYKEGTTKIDLVKGTDYCLRIYKGGSMRKYGRGTTSVKVSCFDEDGEETILARMSMSGPTRQRHKQDVTCFRA